MLLSRKVLTSMTMSNVQGTCSGVFFAKRYLMIPSWKIVLKNSDAGLALKPSLPNGFQALPLRAVGSFFPISLATRHMQPKWQKAISALCERMQLTNDQWRLLTSAGIGWRKP